MNKKSKYIVGGLLLAFTLVTAQNKETKKASQNFDSYAYAKAIENYQTLVDQGYSTEIIYKKLGDANYLNANYIDAANWYDKLLKLEGASVDADYLYRYAQALKSTKDYKAAALWMQKYKMAKGDEIRAKKIANNSNYLADIEAQSGRYDIHTISVNSASSDFAPAFKGEELVFSTARDSGIVSRNLHSWNNKPFTNLYTAKYTSDGNFGEPTKLSTLNKKTHETSAVFTKDGSTVYFTRNNSVNGRFSRDNKGVSRLKLFRATLNDGKWTNITELPFNSDDYSTAHPALSADERKLYFASNMPGTRGESDIFAVDIHEDGSFGTPKNMGEEINTEARETFPFVSATDVLYFASDGHQGLGGLDIFATSITNTDKLHIVNLGKPINSEQDDFAYIINEETHKGFFTSNREGGQGDDDIYSFTEKEPLNFRCNTLISGIVKDKKDGSPLGSASVTLVDAQGNTMAKAISSNDGSFTLEGDCTIGEYKLIGNSEGYISGNTSFVTEKANDREGLEILLDKVNQAAPIGSNLTKVLNLKPIHFDLDKAFIRPDAAVILNAVIAYMKEYPSINVQVQSHTDVRASDSYNLKLSNRRQKSTVAYLIANGIDASRLSGQGFGESQLTNDCTTKHKCNDQRHEENRRSEFIVVE